MARLYFLLTFIPFFSCGPEKEHPATIIHDSTIVKVDTVVVIRRDTLIVQKTDTIKAGKVTGVSIYADPEAFGREIFECVRANDLRRFDKFLINQQDVAYFKEHLRVCKYDESEIEFEKEVREFMQDQKEDLAIEIAEIAKYSKELGVDLKKSKVKLVVYSIDNEDCAIDGEFTVYFACNSKIYRMLFEGFKSRRSWLIDNDFNILDDDGEAPEDIDASE